jgi:hypothetical protein
MAGENNDADIAALEKKQAKEEKVGIRRRMEDAPPIGMGDDGKLITVEKDAPPWKPKVVDADGNEVNLDD